MNASSILLGATVCATWFKPLVLAERVRVPAWVVLLTLTVLTAAFEHVMDSRAIAAVAAAGACAYAASRAKARIARVVLHCSTVALAFALAVRAFPGFADILFFDRVVLSPGAPATTISGYLDPGIGGVLMFALYCRRATSWREITEALPVTLWATALTTAIVMAAALSVDYIHFDPKLPLAITGLYAYKILVWTAVLEEAFFRGIIQEQVGRIAWLGNSSLAKWIAILTSSSLFGLAHLHAGGMLAVLATLAGLGYGWIYARTGRIESAMAIHFLLNTTHFVFFTYPHLA